jgi:hypothetical protein
LNVDLPNVQALALLEQKNELQKLNNILQEESQKNSAGIKQYKEQLAEERRKSKRQ